MATGDEFYQTVSFDSIEVPGTDVRVVHSRVIRSVKVSANIQTEDVYVHSVQQVLWERSLVLGNR